MCKKEIKNILIVVLLCSFLVGSVFNIILGFQYKEMKQKEEGYLTQIENYEKEVLLLEEENSNLLEQILSISNNK